MKLSYSLYLSGVIACALWLLCGCTPAVHPMNPPSHPAIVEGSGGRDTSPGLAGDSLLVNVTRSAGIQYEWKVQGTHPLNILQTIGNGCAFLDYNNDGNLDVLLVGNKLALYKGDGKGHFVDVTHETGLDKLSGHFLGCTVGDYDNDGYDDLYVSGYQTGVLLHNEGGKQYADVTKAAGLLPQPWGTSCTFVDFDNDGRLDLYVGNYATFGPNTKPQLCNFSGILSSCGPRFYSPEHGVLYHNAGAGKFEEVTTAAGAQTVNGRALGIAAADYDGSGRQSLAIANDEMPGDLLHNIAGKFVNEGVASGTAYDRDGNVHGGMGVDWGDYDNDGRLDLAVATFQREAKCLYRNMGAGAFEDQSAAVGLAASTMPYVAFGVKFLDFDNDGWLDLLYANGHVQDNIDKIEKTTYRQPVQLFHNRLGHAFEEVKGIPALQKTIVGRGIAVGDFDNDGREDVLVVDSEGEPMLLHNSSPSGHHWLGVKLIGVKSNRDGIGALIRVTAGRKTLLRRCATDGSYLSASDRRIHFGLGAATQVETISVHWPSGRTDTITSPPINQYLTLREGESKIVP